MPAPPKLVVGIMNGSFTLSICGSVDEIKRYTCNMINIRGTSRSFIPPEILLVCTMGGVYIPVRIGDERHVFVWFVLCTDE